MKKSLYKGSLYSIAEEKYIYKYKQHKYEVNKVVWVRVSTPDPLGPVGLLLETHIGKKNPSW